MNFSMIYISQQHQINYYKTLEIISSNLSKDNPCFVTIPKLSSLNSLHSQNNNLDMTVKFLSAPTPFAKEYAGKYVKSNGDSFSIFINLLLNYSLINSSLRKHHRPKIGKF